MDSCKGVFSLTAISANSSPHSRAVARLTFRQQFVWPTGDNAALAPLRHQIRGASICCLPVSTQHEASDGALFMKSLTTLPAITRDGTSLESTTTYSRSSIWITVAFSGTSVYPGPSSRTCLSEPGRLCLLSACCFTRGRLSIRREREHRCSTLPSSSLEYKRSRLSACQCRALTNYGKPNWPKLLAPMPKDHRETYLLVSSFTGDLLVLAPVPICLLTKNQASKIPRTTSQIKSKLTASKLRHS
ncbi:hypothetical protein AMECASPLE_024679 [Ameca splendens]|uniref:Uncharacterized protein n=1 Tax=Ameca splendens TaxID=208324 RepID=A0ABV1A007_9TELE